MDLSSRPAENDIILLGWGRGSSARHRSVCWIHLHRIVDSCSGENILGVLILFSVAVDVLVHGDLLGENYEESSFRGGEELRF